MSQDGTPDSLAPKSKILYSLLLILLLVGVVPLAINAYVLIAGNAEVQISYVLELQNEMLSNVADLTSTYLRNYRTKLEDMAQSYSMLLSLSDEENPFDTPENQQNLAELITADPNIYRLGSVPLGEDESLTGREGWTLDIKSDKQIEEFVYEAAEQAKQGRFYMSPPYYYDVLREPLIVMAAPVTDLAGEDVEARPPAARGMVFAVISLNQLQTRLSENVKGGLTLFVLDSDQNLVAHTDLPDDRRGDVDFAAHPLVREFLKLKGVGVTKSYEAIEDGEVREFIGTAMPVLGEWRWSVFGQSDRDKALRAVKSQIRDSVTAVLAVLSIVILVGIVFGVSISRPIQLLAEGAMRLARGEYSKHIEFKANNELGQLASVFNYMSQEIQERETKLKKSAEQNQQLFLGTIRTLAAAIDAKDPYTRGHSERVTQFTVAIAEEMGMTDAQVEDMRVSALLHDVGKIGIDDAILRKPGALTDEEYDIMKGHPQKGAEIMAPITQMQKYIGGIRFHHETLAGTGYPLGLHGDQIPVEALIIQVADTFDAMTTDRPYQKAMELNAALDRIQSFVGKRYDQRVVDALRRAVDKGKVKPGSVNKQRSVEV